MWGQISERRECEGRYEASSYKVIYIVLDNLFCNFPIKINNIATNLEKINKIQGDLNHIWGASNIFILFSTPSNDNIGIMLFKEGKYIAYPLLKLKTPMTIHAPGWKCSDYDF